MAETEKITIKSYYTEYEARTSDTNQIAGDLEELIKQYKVVKLIPGWHIDNLREFYTDLTNAIGDPVMLSEDWSQSGKMTGEQWMEIRYDDEVPDMQAFRHSKNAQPLHTDESYKNNPSDVMVFYCQNKAQAGGETVFVDGVQLVQRMQEIAPKLLQTLATKSLTYSKLNNVRSRTILNLNNPAQPQFNYNYFCIDADETAENKKINQDFFDFLETHVKGSYLEKAVCLRPGEGIFWWDHYVLHGRRPFFTEKTNDRLIWKTAVVRG